MKSTGNLFIDIINVLPSKLICHFEAPELIEIDLIRNVVSLLNTNGTLLMEVNESNRNDVIELFVSTWFFCQIEHIRMLHDDKLLFEAWDGFSVGIISNTVQIPTWFKKAGYLECNVSISQNW